MKQPPVRLLLFDIDGTLLRCGAQIGPIFIGALQDVFGTVARSAARRARGEGYSFAGRTDPRIAIDLMAGVGVDAPEIRRRLGQVRTCYVQRLERSFDPGQVVALPGAVELIETLSRRADVALGLLTGNWECGARTKLEAIGLDRYFEFGAFGDDGVDRRELAPVAMDRADRACGRRFEKRNVVIVGDTLEDVRCARENGLRMLAVATGRESSEQLLDGGADWAVETLAMSRLPGIHGSGEDGRIAGGWAS